MPTEKITITIEGPSRKGIGKTTVASIIKRALQQYGYGVKFSALPDDATRHEENAINGIGFGPELSNPQALIDLIEKV